MKASISEVGEQFASHRMLTEYADRYYLPAIENSRAYSEKKHKRTRDTAGFVAKLGEQWPRLGVTSVSWTEKAVYRVGDSIEVEAAVELGDLSPQDVQVELYYGKLGSHGEVTDPKTVTMSPKKGAETQNGTVYGAKLTCEATGRQGYAVRILPNGDRVVHPFLPGLVKWG
jgi:starch phosphorylase